MKTKKGKYSEKKQPKKPLYKKWWFWAIIVVLILSASGGSDTSDDAETVATEVTEISLTEVQMLDSDKFIEEVKTITQGAIASENEAITDVTLKDGDLHVFVDLSNADSAPLTIEDLAISRTGSITEAILELCEYDELWDTITVDFGDIGQIKNKKDDITENEFGGRYFPSVNFVFE